MTLEGKVAVVTGAGRGLGREHALLLAAHGAQVVVNDLGGGPDGSGGEAIPAEDVAAEIVKSGGEAVADASDISEPDGAQAAIGTALDAYGRLDIVVNNAGILRDRVLVNLEDEDWDIVVKVNLRGTFLVTRTAGRYWRDRSKAGAQPAASVINTSSESGVFANPGQCNYAAAKSGVASFTQVAAKELSRYGVRVNAVLPRARTRLTTATFGEALAVKDRDAFDRWDPANVSPLVVYLASPECSLTGEVLMSGGSKVQRVKPWEFDPDWSLVTEGRWTVEGLAEEVARLSQ